MITCTLGSIPSIRIWRAAGVEAVGPWNDATHGRVCSCSTVSTSPTSGLSADTTQTQSSR